MDWSAFVGLPWRDRGRSAEGYDCYGLLIAAFAAGTGIELPSYADDYQTAADRAETSALFATGNSDWLKVTAAQPFDVALFMSARRFHVALFVRPGVVLHIEAGKSSVIVPLARVVGTIEGIYRHKSRV